MDFAEIFGSTVRVVLIAPATLRTTGFDASELEGLR